MRPAPRRMSPGPLLAVAASLALIMAAGWGLARVLHHGPGDAFLTQELVASHVRSQMLPSHRFDVASSDRVRSSRGSRGKLDFSPPVNDLVGQGFPLVGGSFDYLHNRPVAALGVPAPQTYHQPLHLAVVTRRRAAPQKATLKGFHIDRWTRSGMTFSPSPTLTRASSKNSSS